MALFKRKRGSPSLKLKETFEVLRLPRSELGPWVEGEILTSDELTFLGEMKQELVRPEELPTSPNFQEHLLEQAEREGLTARELRIAELLIGHFDHRGFFVDRIEEIFSRIDWELARGVLQRIQRLDPVGVGAKNVQESLLIQLEAKGLIGSRIFTLIRENYEELLFGKTPLSEKEREQLRTLSLRPREKIEPRPPTPLLLPDVVIEQEQGKYLVEICQDGIPPFESIKGGREGRWLKGVLNKRSTLLKRVILALLEQAHDKKLPKLDRIELADRLQISPSTLNRVIENKNLLFLGEHVPLESCFKTAFEELGHKKVRYYRYGQCRRSSCSRILSEQDR